MASFSRKRKLESFDVSEVVHAADATTVPGVITELSPVKVSKKNSQVKYFSGTVSDGKKSCQLVAFDPGLRSKLEKSNQEKILYLL